MKRRVLFGSVSLLCLVAFSLVLWHRYEPWRIGRSNGGILWIAGRYYDLPYFESAGKRFWILQGAPPYCAISADSTWRCFVTYDHGRFGRKDNRTWVHLVDRKNTVISRPLNRLRLFGASSKYARSSFSLKIDNGIAIIEEINEYANSTVRIDLRSGEIVEEQTSVLK